MVIKYGVEYAAQLDEFKNKMKASTLEKYGCEHALQNKDIQNKIKATNLKKYGCEYGLQNEDVKENYNQKLNMIKTNISFKKY